MSKPTEQLLSQLTLRPDAAFARSEGAFITVSDFTATVAAVAETLVPPGEVINLCGNTYRFLIAFAAAVSRGRTTVLPPSHAPDAVDELLATFPGCRVLDDALVGGHGRPRSSEPLSSPGDFVAAIGHTSGSSGKPVAHAKSWSGLGATTALNAARIRAAIGGTIPVQQPWIVATVPPQHMYGLETSVLLPLLGGFGINGARPLLPADVAASLAEVPAPRVLVSTPFHLRTLVDSAADFPEVAVVVSATAPLDRELACRIEERVGATLVECFGSTETCVIATRRTAREDGWRPYPGVELAAIGAGTRVRAPWLATEQLLHDVVELGTDGSFTVVGRGTDVIEVAGKRASLADLTRRLLSIDGVEDAVVFQPPSGKSGVAGRCAALVVAPGLSRREIARRMRAQVDPVFVPRPIVIVTSLPRNEVGKLPLERLLEALATASASRPRRGT